MKDYKEPYKPIEKLDLREIKSESDKEFKKVSCPSCNNDVEASNLNLQKEVAKCGNCDVIFSIEDDVKSLTSKDDIAQGVLRPEGIDRFHFKNNLDITVDQPYGGWVAWGTIGFTAITLLSTFIVWDSGFSFNIPIALALVSMFFIYKTINYSKNKTIIEVSDKHLVIKSRPKNLKKDKTYSSSEIDQLYLKNPGTGYFDVYIITNSPEGQKHNKLFSVTSISKAKYLEQEIESYLKIKDKRVPEANA